MYRVKSKLDTYVRAIEILACLLSFVHTGGEHLMRGNKQRVRQTNRQIDHRLIERINSSS